MLVNINEDNHQFHLTNGKISYIFHVLKNGHLGHLYYGKALVHRDDFSHFQCYDNPTPSSCHLYEEDPAFSLETIRQEYPVYGRTDFREPAISLRYLDGSHISDFHYKTYRILKGKPKLEGLPTTYVEHDEEATTLQIILEDPTRQVMLTLNYTIFKELPVITRSSQLTNMSDTAVYIERMMAASLDFASSEFDMVHLAGAWSRERHVKERRLEAGIQSISSIRGASSHQHNPFLALRRPMTTEHHGEVYGFNFIYSSNFLAQVEVDHYETARVMVGIHPFRFEWKLGENESFQSPEVVMVYAEHGLNAMSQHFHDFYRNHLIRGVWKKKDRPILINNWEATYFDFNEQKLVSIAKEASQLGVELFVLDDGWFGKRNDDRTSLGDWWENKEKLPNGLGYVADEIRKQGLAFGLWFEPEMISPKSELFEEHPDWAISTPKRASSLGRNQRVLDFSREEIVSYIYEKMAELINRTKLSYIKWDMNRYMTEVYSTALAADQQGEFFHRYILGVYQLYERLTEAFPHVLFESCAGGGGRFDPGMFYYAPQAWASDNTDAVERLKIQYGTSLVYPLYSMGSHVSAVPNHQTLRTTSLETRANVAYFGTFGYELNPLDLTAEEKDIIKQQVELYKEYRSLIRDGDFYRLLSPFEKNETAWIVVSKDKREALVGWYKVLATPNPNKQANLLLKGLNAEAEYTINGNDASHFGDELMYQGVALPIEFNGVNKEKAERGGDFQSYVFHLRQR
ncbi:alpha-galactosidase [Halalkalibacter urbisdiaboli]|uniref:alpha-galactosidase n=1 Tax=Halalkalibacter urbisdiaboli TaxID=1960589 RepID=UPI000B44D01C|nr:alpha-galactosidase [Halalkalibacter urbisdiaboli]